MIKQLSNLRRFAPSVRYVHGMEIYFKKKDLIVVNSNGTATVFYRESTLGSYGKSWKPFCEKLRRRNEMYEIRDICAIANQYDIYHFTLSRTVEVPPGIYKHKSVYYYNRKEVKHEKEEV